MNSKNIKIGDQIKTTYGNWYTVSDIRDNIIYSGNQHIHISNVIAVIRN